MLTNAAGKLAAAYAVMSKRQVKSVKLKLHDQEWRDFQPVPEPEGSPAKFKAKLRRAVEKMKRRKAQQLPVGQPQS